MSVKPSLGPGVEESEVGRADTETERGPWALLPSLPSWELPAGQGRLAGERVSMEGPEPLSRRASKKLQPESSLCSPPVGQEVRSQKAWARGIYRGDGQGPEGLNILFKVASALVESISYKSLPGS